MLHAWNDVTLGDQRSSQRLPQETLAVQQGERHRQQNPDQLPLKSHGGWSLLVSQLRTSVCVNCVSQRNSVLTNTLHTCSLRLNHSRHKVQI